MSTQECKYHFYKKNAKILQVFFYILDCVLLKKKNFWMSFQLSQKQLNLSKNAIFQINCFSYKS